MLAAAVLAASASTALAATVTGDGTLVGTPGSDTLGAGNGNDIVWGLGGKDTINAGNGNDMIDAGGHCPAADQGQDFPNGVPGSNQCEHGDQGEQGNATINAGNGNDTIFGGAGKNTVTIGSGTDTISGGPLSDTINTGNGAYTIALGPGGHNTVNIGLVRGIPGAVASGTVNAQNGQPDTINCFGKNTVTVYVDRVDTVNRCARVVRSPAPARDRWRGAVSKNRAAPARKAKAHRAKRHHKRNHHNNSQRPLED